MRIVLLPLLRTRFYSVVVLVGVVVRVVRVVRVVLVVLVVLAVVFSEVAFVVLLVFVLWWATPLDRPCQVRSCIRKDTVEPP